jgi:hypothetical protein
VAEEEHAKAARRIDLVASGKGTGSSRTRQGEEGKGQPKSNVKDSIQRVEGQKGKVVSY